jgi:hypothetical protein
MLRRVGLTGVAVERQQVTLLDPDVPKDNFRDFGVVKSRDIKI